MSPLSRITTRMRDVAERIISYETKGSATSRKKAPVGFHASEKLRPRLATLMGNTGFRAIQLRALALASAEAPWLRAVHVKADGSLGGLTALAEQVDPEEIVEGRVVLLAQLLELLVAFIGEDLTLRLAREVWPQLSFNDLDAYTRR